MRIKFTSLMIVALATASVLGKAHFWLFGFFQG
jgi:hypothetical protein